MVIWILEASGAHRIKPIRSTFHVQRFFSCKSSKRITWNCQKTSKTTKCFIQDTTHNCTSGAKKTDHDMKPTERAEDNLEYNVKLNNRLKIELLHEFNKFSHMDFLDSCILTNRRFCR
ncbi:hypothetical protein BRADI_3g54578v3 [Brachypodium distachyon]|uniref:Uncharacterized protein n=1 Tax=Brachypodium distachyon TaxID=15368 RepID=A0A0Q3FP57_BRADI|nr:hypothetical protein BRADI_3g54578v3 [Brachypodium distachyon]